MDTSLTIIGFLLLAIIIFLVLREFWCWYFKINEANNLLRSIRDELRLINGNIDPEKGSGSSVTEEKTSIRSLSDLKKK